MPTPPGALREIAWLFLRLGATAFGGPAAHVAMMEDEVVRRRRWVTRERFLDYLGAVNLIPGPNSTELAIHLGHLRGGWPGLLVAGACFILPASLIVLACAWAYVAFGSLPAAEGVLYGVKPVVIAVVAQALWGLGRSAIRGTWLAMVATGAAWAVSAGAHELIVLAVAGLAGAAAVVKPPAGRRAVVAAASASATAGPGSASVTTAAAFGAAGAAALPGAAAAGVWPLFLVFAKIGSVLFGSGYVLLAFLRSELVVRLGWITEAQLLDATAIGQVTPGPVFTTATFVGYLVAGPAGAVAATVGIFLPAFVFVALSGPLVPRIRNSPVAGAVLDGVNAASLALMAVVSLRLARAAVVDGVTLALAAVALVALVRYRVNSAWLVLAGAAIGLAWLAWP